jgi:hypothetical protein
VNFNISLSFLKKIFFFLLATLQAEVKSIELQNEQRFAAQSQELHTTQESIITMASDIDEMRRRLENSLSVKNEN